MNIIHSTQKVRVTVDEYQPPNQQDTCSGTGTITIPGSKEDFTRTKGEHPDTEIEVYFDIVGCLNVPLKHIQLVE